MPELTPRARVELRVPDTTPDGSSGMGKVRRRWRTVADVLRGPTVQTCLFTVWLAILYLCYLRLSILLDGMEKAATIDSTTHRQMSMLTLLFFFLVGIPKLFMFIGALIVSRRVQQRRLAVQPVFEKFGLVVDGLAADAPSFEAALRQAEEQWTAEHDQIRDVYIDRLIQHAGLYGIVSSVSLAVAGTMLLVRAFHYWTMSWSPPDFTEVLAVAVVTAVFASFVRDFGLFLVRAAYRDMSAQMIAWSTRRLLSTLGFIVIPAAVAFKAKAIFDSVQDYESIWIAAVLSLLVVLIGQRAADALTDKLGAMFGLPRRPTPDAELTDMEGMSDDDAARLAEEGIESIQALAFASTPRLFLNTRFTLDRICDWQDRALLIARLGATRARAFREQLDAPTATDARQIATHLMAAGMTKTPGGDTYSAEWEDTRKLLALSTNAQTQQIFARLVDDELIVRLLINRWAVPTQIEREDNPAVAAPGGEST